jgi:ATP-dependent Clp protease ATP-binding subunit ClpA
MDASNLIKPMLASGEMKCIGSTTYQEYRGIFEKDRALARRFQKIDVTEPSVEETYQILRGLKTRFEEHHDVKYADKALRAAVELSARYINDRHLPDKAIDVIDEAGASQRLLPVAKRKKGDQRRRYRNDHRQDRPHPAQDGVFLGQRRAAQPGAGSEAGGVRSGRGHRHAGQRHQDGARRLGQRAETHRQLPVRRPDRGGQDRGHPPARPESWVSN